MTMHGFKGLFHAAQMFGSMLQVSGASITYLYMFLVVALAISECSRYSQAMLFQDGMEDVPYFAVYDVARLFSDFFVVQMMNKYSSFVLHDFPSFMFDVVVLASVVVLVAMFEMFLLVIVVFVVVFVVVVVVAGVVVVVVAVVVVVVAFVVVALSPASLPVQTTSLVSDIVHHLGFASNIL